jgi:hypothetical protein
VGNELVNGWRYPDTGATRDLRIDFLRGFVFLLLFTAHYPAFSWFALVGWERVGVVSSAETFIVLAGIVTGSVYGKTLAERGLGVCTTKLFARAWTLYKIAFIVAAAVALLRLVPGLETQVLTQFTDPVSGQIYPLYPPVEAGFMYNLLHLMLLKAGPHQFQVIGLYVVLFLLTPVIFWAIHGGKTATLLLISAGAWLANYFILESQPKTAEIRVTGAQFEFAFPLLAWQFIFVIGVATGYHRKRVLAFFSSPFGRTLVWACVVAAVAFAWFSWNHPLDQMPAWATIEAVPPDVFNRLYDHYFLKYNLGPARLLNNAVLLIAVFALLTVAWKPIHRALGWLFIPLGQESMAVFFVHVFLLLAIANTPLPAMQNVWVDTAIHAALLLVCWAMVRTRFLFRWIPH